LSGSSFVLDCANERREYRPTCDTGDHLRDNAANAQISGFILRNSGIFKFRTEIFSLLLP
jgi:hypothetical protein